MQDFQSLIQKIKNNINLVDIVAEYTKLENKGNNYTACCPFHKEDTPSFFVSEDRQLYHCFGCGVGGDVFTFLQEIESLTFVETAKILAKKAHIPWEGFSKTDTQLRDKLLEINKITAKFYHYVLTDLPFGKVGLDYFKKNRNLDEKTIKKFLLGVAPDKKDILIKYLQKKGFSKKDMVEAGVVTQYNNKYYDRFNGRVVFPIWNHLGQVVGFTGRVLDDNKKTAKYLNTPQTLIFNKSSLVYGLFHAKEYIRNEKKVILVEGQMDVLKAHQAGYKNVVAASGTSLTLEHLKLLKRYAGVIIFCFDADEAGQKALERAIELAWQADVRVKVVSLPAEVAKDPDECIAKAPEQWEELINNPLTVWDYYSNKWSGAQSLDDKKNIEKDFFQLLSKIKDDIEKEFWLQNFSQKFNIELSLLKEGLEKFKASPKKKSYKQRNSEIVEKKSAKKIKQPTDEEHFLALFLNEMFIEDLEAVINFLPLTALHKDNASLYKSLIIYYTNNTFDKNSSDFNENFSNLLSEIDSDYKDKISYLSLLLEKDYNDLNKLERKKHFIALIKKIKKTFVQKEIHKIKMQLDQDKENAELFKKMQDLYNDLNIINKYIF